MKAIKLLFVMLAAMTLTLTSCTKDDDAKPVATCTDGIKNGNETAVDCGGACKACEATPTCTDGIKNGDETDVDCGGSCKACVTTPTCEDGIKNGDETGVDCGGSCGACASQTLSGSLGTRTLTNDRIWIIDGMSYVKDGDKLTIEPGTIVKFEDAPGADASALVIARGATISAVGTAAKPIILTSVNDQIKYGETASAGIDNNLNGAGQWGGLIILGKAPISAGSGSAVSGVSPVGSEARIEGVPAASYSVYGGNDSSDDSGDLEYVSIRYTGTTLSTDSEIQGLTLGGVGSGTSIKNIEIFVSDDDGIEFFGGTVNVSNVVIAYQKDDALDIDQSYAGTIDNATVLNYTEDLDSNGKTKDQGALEIDGPEQSGTNDGGLFTISNTTIMNKAGKKGFPGQFKSSAQGMLMNVAFKGFDNETRKLEVNKVSSTGVEIKDSEFSQDAISINDEDLFKTSGVVFDVTEFTKGATADYSWTYAKSLGLF